MKRVHAGVNLRFRVTILCCIAICVVPLAGVAAASPGPDGAPSVVRAATDDGPNQVVPAEPREESGPLSGAIMNALSRSTDGLQVFDLDNGGRGVDLDGRFRHVFMVQVRADGSFATSCVDHVQAVEKLMGLGSAKAGIDVPLSLGLLAVAPPSQLSFKAAEVSASLAIDPTRLAGADTLGRPLLYNPDPLELGSSISHWDLSATPDLLMEPTASPGVGFGEVDLTLPLFQDIGWPAGSSTVTIRVQDSSGEGFNDATVVPESPANPGGTTVGGQRLAALQWAADVWGTLLGSEIEINIDAAFDEFDCDPDEGAVLAAAGTRYLFSDFANAPRQGTWYSGALAEALAGENLSTTENNRPSNTGDVVANFNSRIDEGCLAPSYRFYYGLDGNTPSGQASFAMVALHEIAHGLGFQSFVDPSTGSLPFFAGLPRQPGIYSVYTFDSEIGLHWNVMTNDERRTSAVNTGRLVWDGPASVDAAPQILGNAPRLLINSPPSLAGGYAVQTAQFGPPVSVVGVSGDLAVVRDGSNAPILGCEPLVNASEITGKIAVIDRGTCLFVEKVKNAQDAGAVAAIIVNNQPQGLPPMGGDDQTIVIPSAGISLADGNRIKRALGLNPAPRRVGRRVAATGGTP